jgi:hypothetical protein
MGREYKKGGFKRERAESPLLFISTAAAAADVAMESKKKEKKRKEAIGIGHFRRVFFLPAFLSPAHLP